MNIDIDDRHLEDADSAAELAADAAAGLVATPKTLPPRWFYDKRGSELFERITELPEYYPTRAETEILERYADDVAAVAPARTVIELGSGSSTKTRLLLDAWQRQGGLHRIVTMDVSSTALREAAIDLDARYPGVTIHPMRADFTRHLDRPTAESPTALVFLGSTIGNLDPVQRAGFLADARALLDSEGDVLLLGTDLVKSLDELLPAYDDAEGVTAAFNLNLLRVINRGLDGDLPEDDFTHEAVWDPEEERVEMRLRASRPVDATLARIGLRVRFEEDEWMRTEISCKFRPEKVRAELSGAGFAEAGWWTDQAGRFALSAWR